MVTKSEIYREKARMYHRLIVDMERKWSAANRVMKKYSDTLNRLTDIYVISKKSKSTKEGKLIEAELKRQLTAINEQRAKAVKEWETAKKSLENKMKREGAANMKEISKWESSVTEPYNYVCYIGSDGKLREGYVHFELEPY